MMRAKPQTTAEAMGRIAAARIISIAMFAV